MSTSGDVQYIGGCSVHRGYHEYIGGYHEYIRGCSVHQEDITMHVGEQVDKSLSSSIENPDVLSIPRCTHDMPLTYLTPPNVPIISPDVFMVSPDVLNTSQCTEHPSMY